MQFEAQLEDLPHMLDFVKTSARTSLLPDNLVHKIELASEEALVNIISYAYPKRESSKRPIYLHCESNLNHFTVVIRDKGISFNPILAEVAIDKNSPVEKRPIGGLGIYLIRQLMDEVTYQREADENVLKLSVKK